MMACKHIGAAVSEALLSQSVQSRLTRPVLELNPPRPSQSVYKEDCTQCFDSIVRIPELLERCLG